MSELRPRRIVLGQPELGVFDAAIQKAHGSLLQDIADRDSEQAIRALSTGLQAMILHWNKVSLSRGVVHEGEMHHGKSIFSVSQEEDGVAAFEGTVKLQVEESAAWATAALQEGRDIHVCTLCDPEQYEPPFSEDDTVTVAIIRHS